MLDKQDIRRVGGREDKVKLSYDSRHPILLPPNHLLTIRIITAFHEKLLHTGTDLGMSHIRQHFWILHGTEAVKKMSR